MQQVTTNLLTSFEQKIPLFLLIIFSIYTLKNILQNKFKHPTKDIDELIETKKRYLYQEPTTQDALHTNLYNLPDQQIKHLLRQLDWGEQLDISSWAIPFIYEKDIIQQQIKRILNSIPSQQVNIKSYSQLQSLIEKHIRNIYLTTPFEDFPADDILSAVKILGIRQNSSNEEIKSRFHLLSKNFHPDAYSKSQLHNHKQAITNNYIIIKKAYELLCKKEN